MFRCLFLVLILVVSISVVTASVDSEEDFSFNICRDKTLARDSLADFLSTATKTDAKMVVEEIQNALFIAGLMKDTQRYEKLLCEASVLLDFLDQTWEISD